ncbi:hypothetical protein EN871_04390 [bacterium M00.F.Ca.ET.228.01.1.1]|uniref:hypothetical protein n=1 Tax=Paraburkholderia phenoliruptrix TaxID=252970 RepID=UPI0010928467|nr:hypothetical protein [Paraburkholderia phenoliruptrix]TGP48036.1 hypothetical protein EN871_04390 [bacterium M00.F.Ca.ET.228.01.1.1]TGS05828.1 hypothetical protein EN834_04390 [bacterium M00.F.Ca.ET.191.01.1.1]TGU10765.1 hypothetical protein EN798_04390 [bacterium M00.F.Ca.ET.155.01.1.1]MBW0445141.1 hypothetical protein [Paraburkholderia phenoliruptrix]MBW9095906.1 hypothetical protein [Paraburkholderia phenoliruptrix]
MIFSSETRGDAHRFFENAGFRADLTRGFVKYRSQFRVTAWPQPGQYLPVDTTDCIADNRILCGWISTKASARCNPIGEKINTRKGKGMISVRC